MSASDHACMLCRASRQGHMGYPGDHKCSTCLGQDSCLRAGLAFLQLLHRPTIPRRQVCSARAPLPSMKLITACMRAWVMFMHHTHA